MPSTTHPDGILFGPTATGKMYLSIYEHRGRNRAKSCWTGDLLPPEEYLIFEGGDIRGHADPAEHLWGIRDRHGAVLGTRGERLAKFPANRVITAPWHGFPVSPASGRASEIPPDALVDRMISEGTVTRTFGRKLQRRKA